jgi:hypothetical protein
VQFRDGHRVAKRRGAARKRHFRAAPLDGILKNAARLSAPLGHLAAPRRVVLTFPDLENLENFKIAKFGRFWNCAVTSPHQIVKNEFFGR